MSGQFQIDGFDFTDTVSSRRANPARPLAHCAECNGKLVTERWETTGIAYRTNTEGARRATTLEGVPLWAALHVLEGIDCVTRYVCRACGETAAVLPELPA